MLMALVAGCRQEAPELAARWHSVGADGLRSQASVPALRSMLAHRNAPVLAERLRTNATRAALEWLAAGSPAAAATVAQAQPLVADLLDHESAGEVWRRADGAREVFVAVRITAERAPLWNDRFPVLVKPAAPGLGAAWVSAEKGWLFAVIPSDSPRAKAFRSRVLGTPSNASRLLDLETSPGAFPGLRAVAAATNGSVVWSGTLSQPGLPELKLDPWRYPTNTIYDPLVSLTAVRGVSPRILSILGLDRHFQGQEIGQMYQWAQQESPFQTYAVVHVSQPAKVLESVNAELAGLYSTNTEPGKLDGLVMYDPAKQILGLSSAPGPLPMLTGTENRGPGFVGFSMFRRQRSVEPVPGELLQQLEQPGLVFYDWEITSENFNHWWANLQVRDISMGWRPAPGEGPASQWLTDSLAKVDNTVTQVRQTGPGTFAWSRKAPAGLTAFEWVLLGRWLDPALPRTPRAQRTVRSGSPAPVPMGLPEAPPAKAASKPAPAPQPKP
jgi:hypothetical protein